MSTIIAYYDLYHNTTDTYKIATEILQKYYNCTTGLQTTGHYRPLQVTTATTVTTGSVGKSHGLLMYGLTEWLMLVPSLLGLHFASVSFYKWS